MTELECTVVETRLHQPGFYETRTRTFYVSQQRGVYLLQAPGAALTLQAVDDLPPDARVVAQDDVAPPHRELAAIVDRYGGRVGSAGRASS